MSRFFHNARLICALLATLFAHGLCAQEPLNPEIPSEEANSVQSAGESNPDAAEDAPRTDTPKAPVTNAARNSVVNLQTTVTGNQEQPRVLYILPWQSPETAAIGFELLDTEQSAVFGHVERDELRRQLEAEGAFD